LDPALADAPFTLGVVVWQTGRAEEAATLFRQAIARRPESAEAHYMLGTVLKQLGRANEAVEEFRAAIKSDGEMAEAYLSLAQMLQQQGDVAGANRARADADRLNQRKADTQASAFALSVGQQKIDAGDLAGGVAQFREAIRLAADNARAHYALALALEKSGARDEARRHFAEAQRLAPYLRRPGNPR
jgi:Flp pilus assembly protein TadD